MIRDKSGSLTRPGHGLGTLGYVSPEQHYGLKVDERTDQFSLAAVAYELLTGRRPLGRFQPPSRWNHQLCRDLDRVILKGLAEQPSERYPSVSDFIAALAPPLASSHSGGLSLRKAVVGLLIALALVAMAAASMAVVAVGRGGSEVPGRRGSSLRCFRPRKQAHRPRSRLQVHRPTAPAAKRGDPSTSRN